MYNRITARVEIASYDLKTAVYNAVSSAALTNLGSFLEFTKFQKKHVATQVNHPWSYTAVYKSITTKNGKRLRRQFITIINDGLRLITTTVSNGCK